MCEVGLQQNVKLNISCSQAQLTIPILSANFLLIGRVSLLTRVPSGYKMKANGVSSRSAVVPNFDRLADNSRRSDAQERARNIKLKNCIPYRLFIVSNHNIFALVN